MIFAASTAAATISAARRIYAASFEMLRWSLTCCLRSLARGWRYASSALSMSIEVAATKRDV